MIPTVIRVTRMVNHRRWSVDSLMMICWGLRTLAMQQTTCVVKISIMFFVLRCWPAKVACTTSKDMDGIAKLLQYEGVKDIRSLVERLHFLSIFSFKMLGSAAEPKVRSHIYWLSVHFLEIFFVKQNLKGLIFMMVIIF